MAPSHARMHAGCIFTPTGCQDAPYAPMPPFVLEANGGSEHGDDGTKQPTSGDCVGHRWQQLLGLNRTTRSPPPVAARDLLDRTEAADLFDRCITILEYDASLPRAEAEIAAAELLAGVAAVAAAGLA